ncbi:MAG: hypothetical protein U5M51_14265 [Emticicia sp.]|nr:hypothetical protein [Emticicia sp.]
MAIKKTDKSLYPRASTGNPQVVMRSEIKTLISFLMQSKNLFLDNSKLFKKKTPKNNPSISIENYEMRKLVKLNKVAKYSDKRIKIKNVSLENFVTTDNILQNKVELQ